MKKNTTALHNHLQTHSLGKSLPLVQHLVVYSTTPKATVSIWSATESKWYTEQALQSK